MRRIVALAALGLLAAAAPVFLGPGADADQQDGPKQSGQAHTIEIGKTESANVDMAYLSEKTAELSYPESKYVKVHFARLVLAPEDYVTVSSPDGSEQYTYYSTSGPQWATSISGDTAKVELHTAGGAVSDALAQYGVQVDKVARGMTGAEMAQQQREQPQPESVCGNDDGRNSVCYKSSDPDVYASAAPVARLLINGTTLCTAWRVGEKNRMLTNNHCFTDSNTARDTEVWFNYACKSCQSEKVGKVVKVRGDKVLDTDKTYDYTLFTVSEFSKVTKFGYLTLADRQANAREKLYIPQHPSGEPTQISMDSDSDQGACRVDQPVYDGYAVGSDVSYFCDTEFGSSGSPVLSRSTHEVIALHHFGGCPNSGVRSDLLLDRIGRQI